MRIPESLSALVDHGIIERVVRPLMSGKEAQIHLIESGGEQRVAKVYKDVQERTFQNRADYTEGRKVRNSRDQRAMDSRSKHGRAQNEAAWKTAEVDMIYRLRAAGVRVPEPFNFIDGVLIMELVSDAEGFPAPRLGDLTFEPEEATRIFHALLAEVVRMLCAGVVHGDLSDFNVLLASDGPVIIDFPQAVDASNNQNARKLLLRDVDNLHRFHAKFAPEVPQLPYAEEMWELYQRNALAPDTQLSGKFRGAKKPVSTESVLGLIADANHDERRRREKLGLVLRDKVPEQPRQGQGDARPAQREQRQGQGDVRRAQREPSQGQGDARRAQREPVQGQSDARQAREPQAKREPQAQREQPRFAQRDARQAQREPHVQREAPRHEQPAQEREPRHEQRDRPRTAQREQPRHAQRDRPRTAQREQPRHEQRDQPRTAQREQPPHEQREPPRQAQRDPRQAQRDPRQAQREQPRPAQREQPRQREAPPRQEPLSTKWGQRSVWRPEPAQAQHTRPLDGPLRIDEEPRASRSSRDRPRRDGR